MSATTRPETKSRAETALDEAARSLVNAMRRCVTWSSIGWTYVPLPEEARAAGYHTGSVIIGASRLDGLDYVITVERGDDYERRTKGPRDE